MAFRDDRLREILAVKGLETPAAIHHKTGLPYPQIGRYTTPKGTEGFGLPNVDTLATIAIRLEVDADYLLDSDARYDGMPALRAAAHMSLDRYVVDENLKGKSVSDDDLRILRRLAEEHSDPPLWSADWRRHHESTGFNASPGTPHPPPRRRHLGRRSLS